TMSDESLELGSVTPTARTGNTITFDYAGATPNKTLSAVVMNDEGVVSYYAKLVANTMESDTDVELTLPDDFFRRYDTVQIFVEEANGVNQTDFASEFVELTTVVDGIVIGQGWTFNHSTGTLTVTSDAGTGVSGWRSECANDFDLVDVMAVEIGNAVENIMPWAFALCTNLSEITIPNGVTSIGQGAFLNCTSLSEITIPNGVTSIGQGAFLNCTSLSEITIPASVTAIGDDTFIGCSSLAEIKVDVDNADFLDIGGVLFDKDTSTKSATTLIQYPIGKASTSYEVPLGVRRVGKQAFEGCTNLTGVIIPDSVTVIEEAAFADCANLASVRLPDNSNFTTISSRAFTGSGLSEVTIPDSVTSIGISAFGGCTNLTSVNFPDNLEFNTIDAVAFSLTGLTEITIPNTVTSIGYSAFYNCASLTSVNLPDNPDFTTISADTFSLSGLTSITIPDTVTSIGSQAFKDCANLTSVKLPDNPDFTTISERMFLNAGAVELTIPSSVTKINISAFEGSGLTSIVIPDSVYEIWWSAFKDCTNLTSVKLPDNPGFAVIGQSVFAGSGLTSIAIPDSVTTIADYAFLDCVNLESVIFTRETPPEFYYGIFNNENTTIYVPYGAKAAYTTALSRSGLNIIIAKVVEEPQIEVSIVGDKVELYNKAGVFFSTKGYYLTDGVKQWALPVVVVRGRETVTIGGGKRDRIDLTGVEEVWLVGVGS
ncbi:MAG: leucine-rich repeat domain-containing protein, partial [Oscillospiraceae bacterium]|nr:leucine-rich repeat domain-containing protein [Oscillospiraceae bacterium]